MILTPLLYFTSNDLGPDQLLSSLIEMIENIKMIRGHGLGYLQYCERLLPKKFLDDVHYRFTMIVDDHTIIIGSMHLVLLDVMNLGCC